MARSRVKLDAIKRLKKVFEKSQAVWNKTIPGPLKVLIDAEIELGKSPVKGEGRFEKYSDSYTAQIKKVGKTAKAAEGKRNTAKRREAQASLKAGRGIRGTDGSISTDKRVRPVNLRVSDTMRESLTHKIGSWGFGKFIRLYYKSKYAKYHDGGNPDIPRRPMLPTRQGEEFSRTITKYMKEEAIKSIDAVLK